MGRAVDGYRPTETAGMRFGATGQRFGAVGQRFGAVGQRFETVGRRIAGAPQALPIAALLLGLAAVVETMVRAAGSGANGAFALVLCLLAVASTAPLAFLGPVWGAIVICAAGVLSLQPFHSLTVAGAVAQLIAAYRLSRSGPQLLAAVLVAPFLVLALVDPGHFETRVLTLLLAGLAPAAAWTGAALRAGGEAKAHRAARQILVGSVFEHTARGERARIARELHDVVAHHVSMIAVRAETARLTTPGLPVAGQQQLSAIGDTARTALTEMRRLLGVLRTDSAADSVPERQPQPGLRELNELLDQARVASGAAARLIVAGSPDPLDPGVELAAYRIVQEALTNARRHAPGAAVDVELRYADDAVRVRIRDNGPGPSGAPPTGGLGLVGMNERAVAVGGELTTGAAAGGGFLVETVLPAKPELAG